MSKRRVVARTLTSACSGRHLALLGAAAEAGVRHAETSSDYGSSDRRGHVAQRGGAMLLLSPADGLARTVPWSYWCSVGVGMIAGCMVAGSVVLAPSRNNIYNSTVAGVG